jgi:LPS-assembly protein
MIIKRRILSLLPFLVFLLIGSAEEGKAEPLAALKLEPSAEAIRIQADQITYDQKEDTYAAEGKVEIFQGDQKITADRVTLKNRTSEVEATGKVILVKGEDVLRSEKMKLNLETNRGIIVRGALFLKKQHMYIRGEEIERIGEETYRIRKGNLTSCDGDWPAWRFTTREMVVTLEEYAKINGATFEIKNVPVLYSPYLVFSAKTQRESGFLIPLVSYSNLSGMEFKNAYYWAIAKNMDATFYLDLASKKGIGEGVEYRYVRKQDSFGQLYAYHLREKEGYFEQRSEQLDRTQDRWQVDFQHEEYMDSSFFAKTRLRAVSDREYFKDYAWNYTDRASEQLISFASLTKNWEHNSLFGEARNTVDLRQEDPTTLQNYPVVNFRGLRQQMWSSPFYYSFDSAYGNFWRDQGTTGQQADLHPRLSMPMRWSFLEVTPEVGARSTSYSTQNADAETQSRGSWDFKTTLATEVHRVFDTGFASFPKIKHIIRPEIIYSYVPDTNQQLIPFPYLSFYDPMVPKTNTVAIGVTQRLIGKISEGPGKSRYQELAYFRLSQPYNLFEANRELTADSPPRRPFEPITGELRIYWLKYISAENITTYDPNKGQLLSSYSLLSLNDSRGDGLMVQHSWVNGVQDQINTSLRVRLHRSVDAIYGKIYSMFDHKSLWTTYGVQYRHQCYTVDFLYSERPSVAGQPGTSMFQVMFNLLGVTSVGRR